MLQWWQQILPIWNAKHRQNPVAGHACVDGNDPFDEGDIVR